MKHDPIHRPPLWEAVVERLRASILSGELAAGARLNEVELAQRFGTSRGPVREATKELAREGLVVELPRRGHVVSTLDVARPGGGLCGRARRSRSGP